MAEIKVWVEKGSSATLPTRGKYCERDVLVNVIDGKFLFANQPFDIGFYYGELPAPQVGTTYTLIVDGEEIATAVCTELDQWVLGDSSAGPSAVYTYGMGWWFQHPDASVTSGVLSIYYADESTGGGSTGGVNKLAQLIDRSVTEITAEDFQGATEIGAYAFYNCRTMASIEIPPSVTKIGSYAFQFCKGLSSFIVPNSVETIGNGVFDNTGLKYLEISESVKSIGSMILNGTATSLESIRVKAPDPPTILSTTLQNVGPNVPIIVNYGCGEIYKNFTNWSEKASQIVEKEGGGGTEGGTENWLFQNKQISGMTVTGLSAPVIGVSYTCFVDGEQVATAICEEHGNGTPYIMFSTEDYRVMLIYDSSWGIDWYFSPDSQVQSGSVSIRING